MLPKIIDPSISHRWFLRTCSECSNWTWSPSLQTAAFEIFAPCLDVICVFWQLGKMSLFYDPVISRPQLFRQDFVINFVTYTAVYVRCVIFGVQYCVLAVISPAAPPPFRPGNPALCGSCPLVTPYYCRLGDLLCYNCMLYLSYLFVCMHVYFVFSLFSELFSFVDFLQYFDTVGWVFWPVKTVSCIT